MLFLVLCSTVLFADMVSLKSKEKSEGEIISETAIEIEMKVKDGVMVIHKSMIVEAEERLLLTTLSDGRGIRSRLMEENANSVTLRLGEVWIIED